MKIYLLSLFIGLWAYSLPSLQGQDSLTHKQPDTTKASDKKTTKTEGTPHYQWIFSGVGTDILTHTITLLSGVLIYFGIEKKKVNIKQYLYPKEISLSDKIKVCYGDLFEMDGIKVIPVSRFFYETNVYKNSLQHQVINKFRQRDSDLKFYEQALDWELEGENPEEKNRKVDNEKEKKFYDTGTTASVPWCDWGYLLLALTKTELPKEIKNDNCNEENLKKALKKLWKAVCERGIGVPVNVPLLGDNVKGIDTSMHKILSINLKALYDSIREGYVIPNEIRFVIYHGNYNKINLRTVKKEWQYIQSNM